MDTPAQPPTGSSTPSTSAPSGPSITSTAPTGPTAIRRGAFRPNHHPRPPYPLHSVPGQRGSFQPRPGFQRGGFRPPFIPRGRGRGGAFGPGAGGFPQNASSRQPLPPGSQPLALPQVERRELKNVVPNEETIKNDYALWFALTGVWSADWVKRVEKEEDCKEYPKLRHLIDMKQSQVEQLSHPPFHLTIPSLTPPSITPNPTPYFNPTSTLSFSSPQSLLSSLPTNTFSSILITPPPQIFHPNNSTTSPVHPADHTGFTYNDLLNLPIRTMSSDPSFVFLWVGEASGLGLERGREALLKWGYRRCEEILWVKTNKKGSAATSGGASKGKGKGKDLKGDDPKPRNLLVNMKEHCLMGIRGTVRRKTDGWFVHCNVDTDVMVYEQDPDDPDPPPYPPKLMSVIENFCLGTRRLHLFAPKSSARRGWVTVGMDDTGRMISDVKAEKMGEVGSSIVEAGGSTEVEMTSVEQAEPEKPQVLDWDLDTYNDHVRPNEYGQYVLPEINEIENLRPKSPVRGDRGGRSDPNTPGVAGNGRGPAMGYGSDMGPGGARLARGGGPRMGTGPRMGSNGSQGQYYNNHSSQNAMMGGVATRGTASLAGGVPGGSSAPPRFNSSNANNMGALNAMANSFNASGSNFSGGGAGYQAGQGAINGNQPEYTPAQKEMLMAMAMQQLQMQMQLQQQQFALQQQEMYRNLVANQQQGQTGGQPQGYDGGIGEDEYDGQHAWRAEGQ